jgi:SAM-dependent methyltransferase
MKARVRQLCAACVLGLAVAATAQTPGGPYQPRMGQPGKDVVWIPSPNDMVEKMLDMARVTPRDFVMDLGSGDGRNVIAAAKRGARAVGVEYNPDLVELSKRAAAAAGVGDKAEFVQGDMFAADISKATALVLFLIPSNLEKLAPKFLALAPGTRIVSNTYEIGGGWQPDETDRVKLCGSWCTAHLYIVPAKVAGTWRLPSGELMLTQEFQSVSGSYEQSGIRVPVENGALRGNDIRFAVNGVEYEGRVNGDSMEGVAKGRVTSSQWTARRVPE